MTKQLQGKKTNTVVSSLTHKKRLRVIENVTRKSHQSFILEGLQLLKGFEL